MGAGLLALSGFFSGCATYRSSNPEPAAVVSIDIAENDFKVVNTHLKGTAECSYVIGIPLGQQEIVSKALGQIRDQASMDNRPVVLVNYTRDTTEFNVLGIFWKDKVTITCDAIEWQK